ncbi:MAG: hypothetical protein JW867_05470 [Candidatus Omnitrophica bacterium]|nr:hypothetical protein [Candidatus Omnitrophota bacterium]
MLIRLKNKIKSQATMEGVVALAAGSLLLGLAFYIWGWGNAQIPIRQMTFTGSRIMAGQPARSVSESGASGGNKYIVWPTYYRAPLP